MSEPQDILERARALLGQTESVREELILKRADLVRQIEEVDVVMAALPIKPVMTAPTAAAVKAAVAASVPRPPEPDDPMPFPEPVENWPTIIQRVLRAHPDGLTSSELFDEVSAIRTGSRETFHSTVYRMTNAESPVIKSRGKRGTKRFFAL